ncbi:MAG: aldehyde dehydrogenase family protein, partial [Arenicellales bacterium]
MNTAAQSLETFKMYIDGQWVDSASGEHFESDNPYTGRPWALIPKGNAEDVDRAVRAAHRAFTEGEWPGMTASQRGALLHRLGDAVAEQAEHLAQVEVRDNGKLIAEMGGQLKYIPQWYYYFGGLADKIEGSVIPIDK